jgi:hypothetical protein
VRIIAAPTATRATATNAKIEVDAWAFSRFTARHYSPCGGSARAHARTELANRVAPMPPCSLQRRPTDTARRLPDRRPL